jgi:hypothetical protein
MNIRPIEAAVLRRQSHPILINVQNLDSRVMKQVMKM